MENKKIRERKVAQVLQELAPSKRKRFGDFLRSPYFNISPNVLDFWTALEAKFLRGKRNLDEKDFFKHWKPEGEFDPDVLSQGFFRLGEALTKFLAQERFQQDSKMGEQMSLEEMLAHELDDYYGRKSKRFGKSLLKGHSVSWDHASLRLRHLLHHASFLLRNDRQAELRSVLERLLDELAGFSTLTRAMAVSSLLNGAFLTGEEAPKDLVEELRKEAAADGPLLEYYLLIISLQESELRGDLDAAKSAYGELKGWLLDSAAELGAEEQVDACIHALNFCIRRINAGDAGFDSAAEIRAWYAQLMHRYLARGRMDWGHFLNYGTILTKGGDLEAVEQLIKSASGKSPGLHGAGALDYLRGLVHYHKGHFSDALRSFFNVMNAAPSPHLGAVNRTMLLRTQFELGDFTDISLQAEAFRQYLTRAGKRKAMSMKRKEAYKDFSRLLLKLTTLKMEPAPASAKLRKLEQEIRDTDLVSKDWLLERVKETLGDD